MRKVLFLVAAMALGVGYAGTASASSNVPNGTTITAASSAVRLSSFITCASTVGGTLTNNPAGQGARGTITSAAFTGCSPSGSSARPNPNPPSWSMEINTRSGSNWTGTVRNIAVDVTVLGITCHYTGTLNASYDNAQRLTLSGSLSTTGGFPCPNPGVITGTYTVSSPNPLTLS